MTIRIRSTTVLCVHRDDNVVMAADGQVTLGHEVLKSKARKLRRLYNDKILAGFAGSTADAFALCSRLESKLEQFNGNLPRSVVDLAKEMEVYMRRRLVTAEDRGRFPGSLGQPCLARSSRRDYPSVRLLSSESSSN